MTPRLGTQSRPLSWRRSKPYVVFKAGGTASGKSTLAGRLAARLKGVHLQTPSSLRPATAVCYSIDKYYHPQGPNGQGVSQAEKSRLLAGGLNLDHPNAFDFESMIADLRLLMGGQQIFLPEYDYYNCARTRASEPTPSADFVIVEGIYVLHHAELRALADLMIAVRASEAVRKERRLVRDVQEGRSPDRADAMKFLVNALAMHPLYVEPTFEHAHHQLHNTWHDDGELIVSGEPLPVLVDSAFQMVMAGVLQAG